MLELQRAQSMVERELDFQRRRLLTPQNPKTRILPELAQGSLQRAQSGQVPELQRRTPHQRREPELPQNLHHRQMRRLWFQSLPVWVPAQNQRGLQVLAPDSIRISLQEQEPELQRGKGLVPHQRLPPKSQSPKERVLERRSLRIQRKELVQVFQSLQRWKGQLQALQIPRSPPKERALQREQVQAIQRLARSSTGQTLPGMRQTACFLVHQTLCVSRP